MVQQHLVLLIEELSSDVEEQEREIAQLFDDLGKTAERAAAAIRAALDRL